MSGRKRSVAYWCKCISDTIPRLNPVEGDERIVLRESPAIADQLFTVVIEKLVLLIPRKKPKFNL